VVDQFALTTLTAENQAADNAIVAPEQGKAEMERKRPSIEQVNEQAVSIAAIEKQEDNEITVVPAEEIKVEETGPSFSCSELEKRVRELLGRV
jgi:hypothetical protein